MARKPKPGKLLELQDIEDMRRQEGIDDVELRVRIRQLKAGDQVKLNAVIGPSACTTLVVRITSIRGSAFRGKLTSKRRLAGMPAGAAVAFTTAHIHSVPSMAVADEK